MKIIIAPNAFKNSLGANAVAQAIERGIKRSTLSCETVIFPIADGGDNTLPILGEWFDAKSHSCAVNDPLGREITAQWAEIIDEKTAIIEMAKASGINLLDHSELDPLKTNTYGTGQLIKAALDRGCEKIILGLGGSATIDGGLGIMMALGLKLFDDHGKIINHLENPLLYLHHIDTDDLDARLKQANFVLLCDVENTLLGEKGAAPVFGPQKGADDRVISILENKLEIYRKILRELTSNDYTSLPGTGAAGGIAVSFLAFCNAKLVNGVDYLLDIMGFDEALQSADLLITAEGHADAQTLGGKGPFGVAKKAAMAGINSILLAGKVVDFPILNKVFSAVIPISNGAKSPKEAIASTSEDLENTAWQLGNLLSLHLDYH